MNKILALLGVASMLAVTPAMAATPAKHMAPVKHASMCMVHGKKMACKHHVAHKSGKVHHVASSNKKTPTKIAKKY